MTHASADFAIYRLMTFEQLVDFDAACETPSRVMVNIAV